MNKKTTGKLFHRHSLKFGLLFLVFILVSILSIILTPPQLEAQTPSTTPDPLITALQATIQAQQLKIENLDQTQNLNEREMGVARREIEADVSDQLWYIKLAAIGLTLVGVSSLFVFYQNIKAVEKRLLQKMETSLGQRADTIQANLNQKLDEKENLLEAEVDKRIQSAQGQISERLKYINPADVRLHVPEQNFEQETNILVLLGFRNIQSYVKLDGTCLNDCVIVHFTKDPKDDPTELETFFQFLKEYHPQPGKVGYLIYIKQGRVPDSILQEFPIITYANSIVTVGMNSLTLARSLIR